MRGFLGERVVEVGTPSQTNALLITDGFVKISSLELFEPALKVLAQRLQAVAVNGFPVFSVLVALADVIHRPSRLRSLPLQRASSCISAIINSLSDALELSRYDDWLENESFMTLPPPEDDDESAEVGQLFQRSRRRESQQ